MELIQQHEFIERSETNQLVPTFRFKSLSGLSDFEIKIDADRPMVPGKPSVQILGHRRFLGFHAFADLSSGTVAICDPWVQPTKRATALAQIFRHAHSIQPLP
jgi:hypothetical protein